MLFIVHFLSANFFMHCILLLHETGDLRVQSDLVGMSTKVLDDSTYAISPSTKANPS